VLDALKEAIDLSAMLASPCAAAPAIGCRAPGKSTAVLTEKSSGDRLVWKWLKGEATDLIDFLDPVNGGATYHVCLYDASPSPQPLLDVGALAGGLCAGVPCWKAAGSKGYAYKDKAGSSAGLTLMKLKSGELGKAKALVKAKGVNLDLPALPLVGPVVVQLIADDELTPQCWQSTFSNPPKKNDATQFKAKQ
jgi:hypothetical protein